MKDQLLAIAILLGAVFGLFWIRHVVLTVAKRKSTAALITRGDDWRSDGVVGDEPTPIAWITTAHIARSSDDERMETAPAVVKHPDRATFVGE